MVLLAVQNLCSLVLFSQNGASSLSKFSFSIALLRQHEQFLHQRWAPKNTRWAQKNDSRLANWCFFGEKLWSSWCKICAHLVQNSCSSGFVFSIKIVLVAAAKRGGLEVDVCVEDVSWCGVEGWCGTGWISREVGARLVKEQKNDHRSRLCRPFKASLPVHFLNMFFNTETCLNCCWAGLPQGIQIKAKP